jgi:hypothetical protein
MDADHPRRHTPSVLVCAASTAVATVVAYLSWLGVSTDNTLGRDANETGGPHQTWQVVGLCITLLLVAGVVGWLGQPGTATVVIPAATACCFTFVALRDPAAHAIWAVWALLILFGGLVPIGVTAYSGRKIAELANQTIRRWQQPRTADTTRAPTGTRAPC